MADLDVDRLLAASIASVKFVRDGDGHTARVELADGATVEFPADKTLAVIGKLRAFAEYLEYDWRGFVQREREREIRRRDRTEPPPFMGMPVQMDSTLDDGTVVVVTPPPPGSWAAHPGLTAPVLVVGTRPLPWVERALRESIHRNLADVYAWLGKPLPTLLTGQEILTQLREAP